MWGFTGHYERKARCQHPRRSAAKKGKCGLHAAERSKPKAEAAAQHSRGTVIVIRFSAGSHISVGRRGKFSLSLAFFTCGGLTSFCCYKSGATDLGGFNFAQAGLQF